MKVKMLKRRTLDDCKLIDSLKKQLEDGKKLSTKQWAAIIRHLVKYSEQINGYEELIRELDVEDKVEEAKEKIEALPESEVITATDKAAAAKLIQDYLDKKTN